MKKGKIKNNEKKFEIKIEIRIKIKKNEKHK